MVRPTKSKVGGVAKISVSISPESAAKLDAYCKKTTGGQVGLWTN